MQTFLPYANFKETAAVLDMRRLGKQRVEAYQILNVLLGNKTAWKNHPAVLMWKGYEFCLVAYIVAICNQWTSLGYKDTILEKTLNLCKQYNLDFKNITVPTWLGKEAFHLSHKSNLIRKKPELYKTIWADVPNDLPYIWPSKSLNTSETVGANNSKKETH